MSPVNIGGHMEYRSRILTIALVLIMFSCSFLPWVRDPNNIDEWVKAPKTGETLLYRIYWDTANDTVFEWTMINEYRLVLNVEKSAERTIITYQNTGVEALTYSYDGETGEEGDTLYVDTTFYAIEHSSGICGPYDPVLDKLTDIHVKTPVARDAVFQTDSGEKTVTDIAVETYVQGTDYFDCFSIQYIEFDEDSMGSFSYQDIYSPVLGRRIYYSQYTGRLDNYSDYTYYSEEFVMP